MPDKMEKLKETLRDKSPLLLLGAGFSLDAVDGKGKPMPSGKKLANELFDTVLAKALNATELEELKKYRDELKEVCNCIRDENLVEERNTYLTDRMSGCRCSKNDFHMKLKGYPWRYIFTLNIDDLVEYLYNDTKLTIQVNGDYQQGDLGAPELIKLHGSVNNPKYGFIFDSTEYIRFMSKDNWLLTQFGIEYLKRDTIILGTEFQEDDLLLVIEKFQQMSGNKKDLNYFFITPEIHTRSLRRKIENNSNMYHIELSTEDFLTFVDDNVTSVGKHRSKIRDYGAVFLDEKKSEQTKIYDDIAHLYLGETPRYRDFFNDWDIQYPIVPEKIKEQINKNKYNIISLYGDPYVGKSCVAMRLLVDYLNEGYLSFQFNMNYSLHTYTYSAILIDYLKSLPSGSKVIMLAENCTILYSTFAEIIKAPPSNIIQLVIITTANTEDHDSKTYLFDGVSQWKDYYISEKIGREYADNIYSKLNEKGHLNRLRYYGSNFREIGNYIRSINDIVDVLYVSQEGRSFVQYFSDWFKSRDNDIYRDAFILLSFFSKLNINSIPIAIFSEIAQEISMDFSFSIFQSKYSDVIRIQSGEIRIRCSRLLNKVLINQLDANFMMSVIVNSAEMLAKNIQDREQSLKNELYQKILKAKSLIKAGIPKEEVLQIINRVKESSKHLSYYWIQYGIINRELTHYEEANNAFREAAGIRGHRSYQVEHAEAKNYMEWGIWELSHNQSHASFYFEQGKMQMANLIQFAPHKYFAYSVHTYVDMVLRYYTNLNESLNPTEANYIANQILTLLSNNKDGYSIPISKRFVKVCERDCPEIDVVPIQKLLGKSYNINNEILDADLLSDDSDIQVTL